MSGKAFGLMAGGAFAAAAIVAGIGPVSAEHSWSTYHWKRTSTAFMLDLGDNVSSTWDKFLEAARDDWNHLDPIALQITSGGTKPKQCRPSSGKVEICSERYGFNGWLGLAQIWISDGHITQGVAKLNDSYFNTATYNKDEWRYLVMCQEVAHTFGLDHQDENFNNTNLGSCMDYTGNPLGPPSNEHPNQHDYDQLLIIYDHMESDSGLRVVGRGNWIAASAGDPGGGDSPAEWGRAVAFTSQGQGRVFVNELGGGRRLITFVFWTEDAPAQRPH